MTTRLILIKDCEVGNTAEMYNAGLFYGPVFLCLYGAVLSMCNLCHDKKGKKEKKKRKRCICTLPYDAMRAYLWRPKKRFHYGNAK